MSFISLFVGSQATIAELVDKVILPYSHIHEQKQKHPKGCFEKFSEQSSALKGLIVLFGSGA